MLRYATEKLDKKEKATYLETNRKKTKTNRA